MEPFRNLHSAFCERLCTIVLELCSSMYLSFVAQQVYGGRMRCRYRPDGQWEKILPAIRDVFCSTLHLARVFCTTSEHFRWPLPLELYKHDVCRMMSCWR
ncbi:hypothetical protein KP509_28G015500 [Ceratopteris richardii]|uniref:Uncharacterized protein n=1 Tax=Ceratopteris richardii TaxID=49495 RepID=A0A8T2RCF4_CERRI|nr:hypothetical protein KP509_28G015500 [Ceratopteris richardii]